MNAPNLRITPDVSNRDDFVVKLLQYASDELASANKADSYERRSTHMARAQVFMSAALAAYNPPPVST
jgi:hypothetical protein